MSRKPARRRAFDLEQFLHSVGHFRRLVAYHATSRSLPHLSQEVLAEMVGTTRSRVNFFMNRFRKLGFIDYSGGITSTTRS